MHPVRSIKNFYPICILFLSVACSVATTTGTDDYSRSGKPAITPPFVEGLNRDLEKIYLADTPEITGSDSDIYQQLQAVADKEGFRLELLKISGFINYQGKLKTVPWIEDFGVLTPTGLVVSRGNRYVREAMKLLGNTYSERDLIRRAPSGEAKRETDLFFEGGNILMAVDTAGNHKLLLGTKMILVNALALMLEERSSMAVSIEEGFSRDDMVRVGLELDDISPVSCDGCRRITGLDSDGGGGISPEFILRYIAAKEKVLKRFAEKFAMDRQDTIEVPNYDYHLDVFMRPFHDGEILIQDPATRVPGASSERHANRKLEMAMISLREHFSLKLISSEQFHAGIEGNYANGIAGRGKSGLFYITNSFPAQGADERLARELAPVNVYFISHPYVARPFRGGVDCMTLEQPADPR